MKVVRRPSVVAPARVMSKPGLSLLRSRARRWRSALLSVVKRTDRSIRGGCNLFRAASALAYQATCSAELGKISEARERIGRLRRISPELNRKTLKKVCLFDVTATEMFKTDYRSTLRSAFGAAPHVLQLQKGSSLWLSARVGAREAVVIAQRVAFVCRTKQPASLQNRHYLVNEDIQHCG